MRALRVATLLLAAALAPALAHAQEQQPPQPQNPATMAADESTAKAQKLLDQMIAALGGDKWLNLQNRQQEARTASFYQGKPNGGYGLIFTIRQGLDHDRIEFGKKRDIVDIIVGPDGYEMTYMGRKRMDRLELADYLRRRDHSIETVVHTWLKKPGVALFYDGQKMSEGHLMESVTVMTADNDSVTLLIDSSTHLPRRRTFYWRDPEYHDKNEEGETYDDWHLMEGLPTPLTVTRYKNNEMTRQVYVTSTKYNQALPPDTFDLQTAERALRK